MTSIVCRPAIWRSVRSVIVMLVPLVAGCSQADGPVPAPDETEKVELVDVARDLQYIASGGDPEGPKYLADDIRKYARTQAVPAVDELSRRTAAAVSGKALTPEAAQQLTHQLWLATNAREFSERQIEQLQMETGQILSSIGVADQQAQQVTAQVAEVQRLTTDRPRRWYELF